MPIPTQVISVDLKPMNQQAPTTAGPVGRIDSLNNGVVHKFTKGGSGPKLRIDKRPGFTTLPSTVNNGDTIVTLPGSPRWLSDFRGQLVGCFQAQPYVFSENDQAWEYRNVTNPAIGYQTLTERPVFNLNTAASSPDSAAAGAFTATVLRSGVGAALTAYLVIQDLSGVMTLPPNAVKITHTARIKIASDGANFWVFSQAAGFATTFIQVFGPSGAQLATTSVAWGAARDHWDIRFANNIQQMVLATPLGATTDVRYMTYFAGSITLNYHTTPAADCTNGCAFLDNNAGTNVYLAGCDATFGVRAFELTNVGNLNFTFAVDPANAATVQNITGYAQFGGTFATFVVVAYAIEAASPINNTTKITICDRAATTTSWTQRSLSLASRAWCDLEGNYFVVTYYQSAAFFANTGTVDYSKLSAQPSYFVTYLAPGKAPVTVGQFAYGTASFASGAPASLYYNPWHLSSVTADANGKFHTALGYFGEQSIVIPGAGPFYVSYATNFTGVNDYMMSPRAGRPIETTDELLIPGLQAGRFDGAVFVEDGIALAPEFFAPVVVSAGVNLTANEPYFYVGVYEWLDNAGNIVQSIPSVPVTKTYTAPNLQGTVNFSTLRVSIKQNVRISVYRTFSPTVGSATPGIELRKIGEVANDPTTDTVGFLDNVPDVNAADGQSLYTQPLNINAPQPLEYYPAPAFSSGITFDGRTFIIGYDNAIWFSEQRIDGFGAPFNPALRIIMPTTATVLAIVPMDARLLILCADGTAWTVASGGLPNNTLTTGSIPQPEQLPFTVGSTGAALMLPIGAIFASDHGAWLMDRGLSAEFIGAGIIDELTGNLDVIDICVDDQQRVYMTVGIAGEGGTSTRILVYDLVVGCWYTWNASRAPIVACSWKGRYVFADTASVWRLDLDEASTFTDNGDAIITTVSMSSMSFAGPDGYMRLWGGEFYGQYKGPHLLDVTFVYDNEDNPSQVFTQPIGLDPELYRWDFRQDQQKMIAVAVTFQDNFTWPVISTVMSHTP